MSAKDELEDRVRAQLRRIRTERGYTLAEAAQRAGMDTSTLSRLESGARRLTLAHLPALARALDVTTDALLEPPKRPDPRVKAKPHTHHGMTFWPLSQQTPAGLHAYKIRIGADRPESEPASHEGHEWLYVLSGRLKLILGDDEFTLEPGEAAEFSTWTPHWIGALDGPVEVLGIFGPQGERVHLRSS
jgi:transcriptional regulator with XRE-family HTH domain